MKKIMKLADFIKKQGLSIVMFALVITVQNRVITLIACATWACYSVYRARKSKYRTEKYIYITVTILILAGMLYLLSSYIF